MASYKKNPTADAILGRGTAGRGSSITVKGTAPKRGKGPKGFGDETVGGPQAQYGDKSIGTRRYDITDKSLNRGRGM